MAKKSLCSVKDCRKPEFLRTLCKGHYHKLKRYGDPLGGRQPKPEHCCVDGCRSSSYVRGFCTMHYQRWQRHGDPHKVIETPSPALDWIMAHASFDGDRCLTWPFYRNENGYGHIGYRGKKYIASRLMCILTHGDPPSKIHECAHSCGKGNEGCVNPKHLRWATPSENQQERRIHGTSNAGDRHWTRRRAAAG